ncbi:MAG: DUF2514 family protein [Proteobacteria bacterium]|nr:DUF2514 family protein [Pseudomonadota bacterium]
MLAAALAVLLLVQTLRLADAHQARAQAIATLHTERATLERQTRVQSENYRILEGKHREDIDKIRAGAQAAITAADADAGRARAARDGLQRDLATYITDHRSAAQARAAAGQCAPDTEALDMLADLQRRSDERAGDLAAIADQASARGSACEREHDAATAMMEAASAQAR